ncbi:hypothetical protein A1353_00030 [Methylomonas methanica]|uniref:HNH endonuclease n=1 Tax=Methylomonas methanica TaxID=421 RepID=A0A177MVD2_METMH|nr:hypothetical protein [Methylomonas methanica]OAI09666.1 hypothetical protein A1353_00030 [Methylomonas methanica]
MNKIQLPDHDDYKALFELARNSQIKSYPKLLAEEAEIIASYTNYLRNNGNASIIQPKNIEDDIAAFLRHHYESPPKELSFIRKLRKSSAHKVCAMCGSFGSETLDHVLPRASYPEFSIFAANLVPACPCNSLRSEDITGTSAEERILHPYFDDCLADRLLAARIDPPFGEAPSIALEICIPPTEPLYPAVKFHVSATVQKTAILGHLDSMWASLWRRPPDIIPTLEDGTPVTALNIERAIQRELSRLDSVHDSRNNWDSIFMAGLENEQLIDWLVNHINNGPPTLL